MNKILSTENYHGGWYSKFEDGSYMAHRVYEWGVESKKVSSREKARTFIKEA